MTVQRLVDALRSTGKQEFTRPEVLNIARSIGVNPNGFLNDAANKVRRGVYSINGNSNPNNEGVNVIEKAPAVMHLSQPKLKVEVDNLVPKKDATYVAFGFHKDLTTILSSKNFYPVFITGLSGNGKTTMVEQVCASLKREAIRVNISIETDEDDLIGSNTLIDGNVVYREGPVLLAMKRGAVLILDECDRGSNKLMCLQAILEGKPYFNKKTGETVYPAPGFNIVATANTKGQGSDSGKYMSAQILDDAFLERFAVTIEQEYPSVKVEKKIVMKKMERVEKVDEDLDLRTVIVLTAIPACFEFHPIASQRLRASASFSMKAHIASIPFLFVSSRAKLVNRLLNERFGCTVIAVDDILMIV